jgi:hypothetical protein
VIAPRGISVALMRTWDNGVPVRCLACGGMFPSPLWIVVVRVGAERLGFLCIDCLEPEDREHYDRWCHGLIDGGACL